MFYKVLVNGQSCHGGNMVWSLPSDSEPGDWHTHEGPAIMCAAGFHLTDTPSKWYKEGAQVYEAECEQFVQENTSDQKSLFKKVRLLRLVPDSELSNLKIVKKSTEVLTHVQAACQDATVYANESSVRSYGRSIVFARSGSRVKAYGNTLVFAEAGAQLELYDNAMANVTNYVSVNAWGNSKVFSENGYYTKINSIIHGRINRDIRAIKNKNVQPGVRLYDQAKAVSFYSEVTIRI